jgi:hypothetical protein
VYSNLARDSGGIQNRLGSLAFMVLYLGVMGLSSLPIWRAERLLFIRCAGLGTASLLTGSARLPKCRLLTNSAPRQEPPATAAQRGAQPAWAFTACALLEPVAAPDGLHCAP